MKKFQFTGSNGENFKDTAENIYHRVVNDARWRDYGWVATAPELMRLTSLEDFPHEYAVKIRIEILNCFARIDHYANNGGDRFNRRPVDAKAANDCYNFLASEDSEEAKEARRFFLREQLDYVTQDDELFFARFLHPGNVYRDFRQNWRKARYEELESKAELNFEELHESLLKDYRKKKEAAEKRGIFEKSDKETEDHINKIVYGLLDELE